MILDSVRSVLVIVNSLWIVVQSVRYVLVYMTMYTIPTGKTIMQSPLSPGNGLKFIHGCNSECNSIITWDVVFSVMGKHTLMRYV